MGLVRTVIGGLLGWVGFTGDAMGLIGCADCFVGTTGFSGVCAGLGLGNNAG